jgi:hypothetical protein
MAGKHLTSFESFCKRGVVTRLGEQAQDDEYGCLWSSITLDGEEIPNVNCGQLLGNKLMVACAQGETVELSFLRYHNGEKDFNSIAALKSRAGVIRDVEFSVAQLRLGAAKMRRWGWIGVGIGVLLIATIFIAVVGIAVLAASIVLLLRAKRPLNFAAELEKAAGALA